MDEKEALSLKVGERIIWSMGNGYIDWGTVSGVHHAAFKVKWDNGLDQTVSYNEAHYIYRPPASFSEARGAHKLMKLTFSDRVQLDVDVVEFGAGGIGGTIDHLAAKHGPIIGYDVLPEKA